jgi:NAD(P)-dependent dehydrogenase (short-subunit alcohol dehydrogenase family)
MAHSTHHLLKVAGGIATGFAVLGFLKRLSRRIEYRDRVVVITGGSRGLGLVLARQLAAEGAKLAICARDEQELEVARAELMDRGVPVLAQVCDVSSRDQITHFVQTAAERYGRIDVLINNAGVIQVGPLDTLTHEDFEQAMNTHFWAVLHAVNAALPFMRSQGEGRIVNVASIGGQMAVPHLLPYSASKFALVGFSDGLRAELLKERIYVTTVSPGLMRTGSPRNATFKGKHRAEYAWFSIGSSIPLLTMSAERAANQIISACRFGQAKVTLSLPAKLAVAANALAPELISDLMGLANKLLPQAGGIGRHAAQGKNSSSWASPSILTTLTDRAAIRNNEMVTD